MRWPKGIRKIVEKYSARIEERLGFSVDWEDPHGCGSFGCAFPTGDPEKVLKLSADPTEGPVASAIMKTGLDKRLTGLGRIYAVWRIPEPLQEGPRSTGWVILRENIRPFDFGKDLSHPWYAPWGKALTGFNAESRASIDWFKGKRQKLIEYHHENAQAFLGELYNYQETYFVAEAVEELGRQDIILADIHAGNLGYRIFPEDMQEIESVRWFDGVERPPLLIFDPGHSSAPEDTPVEELWAMAGRANRWARGEAAEIETL